MNQVPEVERAIEACDDWIKATARKFCTFYGSMHAKAFDEESLRSFLLQLETAAEVELCKAAIDVIASNYWNARCVEDCLRCDLRPRIDAIANGRKVIHVPFGNVEDSSTLLYASPFKGENLNPHNLFEFLYHSKKGRLQIWKPGNSVLCFIDDNTSTGRQAPAIFAQWLGKHTPEEESHVLPLPEDLQEYLREFEIVLCTIYASHTGVQLVKDKANLLGLDRMSVASPAMSWENTSWKRAVASARLDDLQRMFEKYGKPLLADKVGSSESDRRTDAMGYGGLGRLFLFWYQTPTSMPVMLWRYGIVNGRFWKPLFWRESDYERFVRRFDQWPKGHEQDPMKAWLYYQAFVDARRSDYQTTGVKHTFDEINHLFEITAVKVRGMIRDNAKPEELKSFFHDELANLTDRTPREMAIQG